MKLRKKQIITIAIGAVIALLLGSLAAHHIDKANATIRNQQETIKKQGGENIKLLDTVEQKNQEIKNRTQESEQKDQKIQDLEKQVQARAESKRLAAIAAAQAQKAARVNTSAASFNSSSDCAAEITKYNWPQGIAYNVMMAESDGHSWKVNDNPATGDYSVGCFQVNLYGANAASRPSEAALKDAATNVQWAYNNWVANGRSFIGQWGVCRSKVACS